MQVQAVLPDPRSQALAQITFVFSEPVTNFERTDLTLKRDGGADLLGSAQVLSTTDFITWTLGNLTPLTGAGGTYTLSLDAVLSGITDRVGNPLAGDAVESWLMDGTPPSVDIVDVTPDPRTTAVSQIDIVFSEPVDGLDLGDLVLLRDEGANLLPGAATLTTVDHVTWTLGNLTGLTGVPGAYALLLAAPGSQIVDGAGNPLPHGTTETWFYPRPPAHVAGRHIFYNHSCFDGNIASRAPVVGHAVRRGRAIPVVEATSPRSEDDQGDFLHVPMHSTFRTGLTFYTHECHRQPPEPAFYTNECSRGGQAPDQADGTDGHYAVRLLPHTGGFHALAVETNDHEDHRSSQATGKGPLPTDAHLACQGVW